VAYEAEPCQSGSALSLGLGVYHIFRWMRMRSCCNGGYPAGENLCQGSNLTTEVYIYRLIHVHGFLDGSDRVISRT